jgi:RNA polymerase sigma-70 factor (ECF subfamily)
MYGMRARAVARDELAERRAGDALEGLIARHDVKLRRFAAAILVDRGTVDDVMQTVYLRAFTRGPAHFDGPAHEAAWLSQVVYRCCIDELRRRKRRREAPPLDATAEQASGPHDLTPADEIWRGLSDGDRAVLLLVDVAGFDYGTAARLLRVPRGTVASRLSAARERLRRRIEDERRG